MSDLILYCFTLPILEANHTKNIQNSPQQLIRRKRGVKTQSCTFGRAKLILQDLIHSVGLNQDINH